MTKTKDNYKLVALALNTSKPIPYSKNQQLTGFLLLDLFLDEIVYTTQFHICKLLITKEIAKSAIKAHRTRSGQTTI